MSIHTNTNANANTNTNANATTNLYSFVHHHHQNKIMSYFTVEAVGGFLWTAVILSMILYSCFIKLNGENREEDVYTRQINRLRIHKCECVLCKRKKH